jgi:ribosome-associated translation inhibitor RaiA
MAKKEIKEINLHEIEMKWITLDHLLRESEGELTEEIERFFKEIENDLSTCSDKYAYVLKMLKSSIEKAKVNKEIYYNTFCLSLDKKAKSYQANLDKLSKRIQDIMIDLDLKTIQGEQFKLSLINSKDSLETLNYSQDQLAKFKEKYPTLIKTEYSLDKEALRKAIESNSLPTEIHAYIKKNQYVRVY